MGQNLTKEKIEKIKAKYYEKKKEENNYESKLLLKVESKIRYPNKDYLNITFKRLYKSQFYQKENDNKNNINNINIINNINNISNTNNINNTNYNNNNSNIIKNIDCSINNKTTEKVDVNNNLELIQETKNINKILIKDYNSFEYKNSINLNIDNYNKEEINITSISLESTKCPYIKKRDPNSAPNDTSINSDYIDISQSTFFIKSNNINNIFNKHNYGNSINIRDAYYNKLIIKKIWKPFVIEKKLNTLFFFDWDDTLMCTSYIIPIVNSNTMDIKTIREKLKNLDENVSILLNKCLDKGIVFIITNAASGWVEYSSTHFLPLTSIVLGRVKIISAKSLYSKNYPGGPIQWKIKAFKYAIKKYNINTRIISNIISLGDSYIDLEAIENLKYDFRNPIIKLIKFKEKPHPVELEKQIYIVIKQLDYIINKLNNFSLKVSKKKKE